MIAHKSKEWSTIESIPHKEKKKSDIIPADQVAYTVYGGTIA